MIDLGPLDQRSYVYAADGSLLTTLQAEIDRQPVPLSEIPQHTIDAVLAVEDADFYSHDGVNIRSTLRALVRNVDEGETVQGGSTITQQVVKEELVGNEQSLDRKAREAVLARRLEDLMTKDEILERYLNTVYLGNGAYGVQAGAETYFDRGRGRARHHPVRLPRRDHRQPGPVRSRAEPGGRRRRGATSPSVAWPRSTWSAMRRPST